MTGSDDVVPFAVKAAGVQIDLLHLRIGHFAARGVLSAIQATPDREAFRRGRPGDELDDRLVVAQGFAAPIRRDEGEQAMFDLVPLAGAGRKVTDGQGQTG